MPVQVRETMKPGETIEGRDNRFSSWGDSVGYYRKPSATMTSAYKTDSRLNSLIDPDHARLDVAICERIRTMHTRSSGASSNNIDEEIASSTRTSTFRDHFHSHKEIISSKERDPDDFRDCFDKYSSTGTATVPTITLDLVPKVVVGCLGLDTPHYIIDKFAKLAAGAIHERYLSWSDFRLHSICVLCKCYMFCVFIFGILFRRLVPKVYQALRAECTSQKSGDSGLLMLMNKPPLADKDLGPFGDLSSTYRDNFRAPDEHSAESPVSHLHAGTTRGTLQVKPFFVMF